MVSGVKKPPQWVGKVTAQRRHTYKNQTFGLELKMTSITCEKTTQDIVAYFGTFTEHIGGPYNAWVVSDYLPWLVTQEWKTIQEGSIEASHDEEQTELVSSICRWEDT